ncbi:ensconsin-like [Anguilla anguilla]|uniref:ensconsin-like n=1 Tax=Anguilla anguilla TaxID=7936 RepID=UPI0015B109A4|nr:ensconsin-like [Anguilla anguilla]
MLPFDFNLWRGTESPEKQENKALSLPASSVSWPSGNSSAGHKPERLFLKVNERQKLAQERRKEWEEHLAEREAVRLQREERARQHREKQLAERRRKLTEQRLRTERRHAAVEEKRRKKLEEETERHKAVVQRTLERSQQGANHRASRCSWSGRMFGHSTASESCHSVTATSLKSLQRVAISRLDNALHRKTTHKTDQQDNEKKIRTRRSNAMTTMRRATAPPTERKLHNPAPKLHLPHQAASIPASKPIHYSSVMNGQREKIPPASHSEGQEKAMVVRPTPEPIAPSIEPTTIVQLSGGPTQAVPSTAPPPASLCPSRPRVDITDPKYAARLLAERRRQAREQKEKEEEERRHREETERNAREETAQRLAVKRARQEEEAQHLAEEQRKREEEEKHAEEERKQKEREEAERLQKQREEEEANQRQEAEQLRLERERHFQKEEAERTERKKRLEEIMKRTRKADSVEKKPIPNSEECLQQKPELDTESKRSSVIVTWAQPHEVQGPMCNGKHSLSSTLPPAGERFSVADWQPVQNRISVHYITNLPKLDMSGKEVVIPVTAYRRQPAVEATAQHG